MSPTKTCVEQAKDSFSVCCDSGENVVSIARRGYHTTNVSAFIARGNAALSNFNGILVETLLYTNGIWEKAVKLCFGQQWNSNQTPLGL